MDGWMLIIILPRLNPLFGGQIHLWRSNPLTYRGQIHLFMKVKSTFWRSNSLMEVKSRMVHVKKLWEVESTYLWWLNPLFGGWIPFLEIKFRMVHEFFFGGWTHFFMEVESTFWRSNSLMDFLPWIQVEFDRLTGSTAVVWHQCCQIRQALFNGLWLHKWRIKKVVFDVLKSDQFYIEASVLPDYLKFYSPLPSILDTGMNGLQD